MRKKQSYQKQRESKTKFRALILLAVFVISLLSVVLIRFYNPGEEFLNEAHIDFYKPQSTEIITTVYVEIANTTQELFTGLMYRESMPDTVGMFFMFPAMQEQSFWMKNTIISLDIIYIDNNGKIVTIHENTQPYSEESLKSTKPAQYVVEVNAGFCKKHGIVKGDYINIIKK